MNKIWLQSAGVVVSLGACFTYSQELSTFNEQLLKSRQRMVAAIDSAVEKGRWTRRSADVSEIQNVLSTDVSTFYLSLIKSTQQNQLRLIEKKWAIDLRNEIPESPVKSLALYASSEADEKKPQVMIALNPTASVEKKVQETKRKLFSEIPDPECIVVLSSKADLAYANDQNQIYISARKYRALPSENARTFVAAHELGHLKRKHPIKTWQLRASLEKITGKLTKEMNREIQKFVRATELEADLEAMLRGGVSIATGAEEFHEDDEQQTLAYTTMDDHPSPQARKGIAQLLRAELELLKKMNG